MILITEFQYFPSVILYKKLNNFSNIVFEQYEYYQKMTFRNRCRVAGAEGSIDLSIPLEKGRDQRSPIKDVRIANSRKWQAEHWKTLLSCYSRSPWFEFYRDELEGLYRRPVSFLMDWNLACFEWSIHVLELPLKIGFTEAWQKTYPEEGWVDWRGKILPKELAISGLVYRQVFEERTGFLPGLSILDLLFCEGKNTRRLLADQI
jgi:WbqC-like protein family